MAVHTSKKESLLICHIADVHLGFRRYHRMTRQGFNQREADVNAAFKAAIEKVVSIQPDVVLIAGDLFHTVRPSNAVVTFCFKQLKRLARHTRAQIVLIAGNHDSPKRIDSGSILRLFREIDGVHVADSSVETFVFSDLNLSVTCAPHTALVAGLQQPLRASDATRWSILVAHAQVDERLRSEFGGELVPFETLSPHEWDYIALGHVHRFTQVTHNAVYAGSLEFTSGNFWAESGVPRGFVVATLPERTIAFEPITTVRTIEQLEPLTVSGMDPDDVLACIQQRLDAIPGGIDGKVVRLDVHGIQREIAKNLDYRVIRKYKARALHLQLDLRIATSIDYSSEQATTKRVTLQDEVVRYCDAPESTVREPELIKEKLLSYLQTVETLREAIVD